MKLYRVSYQDPLEGTVLSWHTSKRKAQKQKQVITREGAHDDNGEPVHLQPEIEPIDVPTKRAELAEWLSAHFNRDNG